MNHATRFMRLALALVLVGALVLAGCGGDGDGVESDLRDQIAALEGDLSSAQTAQAAAEAAQTAAEEAQAEAEAAQAAAEMERDAANTARGAAEAAQMAAEEAEATAKAAQMAAEEAQTTAEAAQAAAMQAQTIAETERDAATGALAAAETARDAANELAAAAQIAQAEAVTAANAARDAAIADATRAEEAAAAAQTNADELVAAAQKAQMDAETAAEMAAQAQMDAETARDAAIEAQGTAETERDAANDAKTDAETAQATAEAERNAANDAKTAAEAAQATAEQAAEDARAAQKTAEDNAKKYMDELAALRGDVDDTTEADRNAAAQALLAVLMNNNVEYSLPAGVDRGDATTAADATAPYNKTGLVGTAFMDVSADSGDVTDAADERQRVANDVSNLMVEVSEDGMLMAEVEDNAAYSMSDMAPDMIEGWRGAELTRDHTDGSMDTVVVYSDIGNDGSATLLDRYTSTLPTTTMPRIWTVTPLGTDGDPLTDGHIPWSQVERPDSETAFAGTGATAMLTFQGTVHGISGTFSCLTGGTDTAACKAPARYSDGTVNTAASEGDTDDGASTAATAGARTAGAWTFVPDAGVSLYTDDADYLTFGWWLLKDEAGNPDDFLAFSTATGLGVMRAAVNSETPVDTTDGGFTDGATVHTDGATIRGSATYSGAAAGKYATASTAASATYEGGHFTADATLMVDFDADLDGDTTVRTTDGVSLSGTIDNFMTGDTARPDWMVNLMVDNNDIDGDAVTPTMTLVRNPALTGAAADNRRLLTTWSTGGGATGAGTWTAQWYGGVTLTAPNRTAIDTVGLPAAVIGTFNANIGGAARLQGAFGAMKE